MLIMNRDRSFWTDFIALYKALPSLWRRGSKEYANKCLKAHQYEQLVAKLRERYPKADRQTAIRKINCFRTNYRREKRMVAINRRMGELSSPTLWYFEQLSFLDESLHWKCSRKSYEEEIEDEDIYSPWQKQLNYADFIELYDEMLVDSDSDSEEDGMEHNRSFWQEFLEIYAGLPFLWNTSCDGYRDRQRTSRDYKVLVDKLRELYPRAASKDMAKRRIDNFRSAFSREHRKVLDAERSMLIYVPTLWCYNQLLFLSDHLDVRDDLTARDEAFQKDFISGEDCDEPVPSGFYQRTPTESLTGILCHNSNNSSPLEDSIALSWSAQYKEMDMHQKVLARKLIGDILFHGCLGNLSMPLTLAVQNVFNTQQT